MSNYPKYQLSAAIAQDGEITIPPLTSEEAGLGRLSQQIGWGRENAIPIEQGGIPPFKSDFNGVFFLLSQFLLWYQQGGIMNYSALLDYEVGNEVMQNGTKYRCIQANGPSTTKVAPGTNRAVWKNIDITVPAGAVVPFHNVTLGGSDGRRPVFWGTTQADEGWILCDGQSDGKNGVTPNLIGKFIKGSLPKDSGTTGGASTIEIPDLTVNGTVGATALTAAQMPAHSHSGITSPAGAHTHTRGSMNITGQISANWLSVIGNGPLVYVGDHPGCSDGRQNGRGVFNIDASRTWTGETSSNGSHQHGLSIGSTGGSQTHTHTLTANAKITGVTNEPPFYTLAYFLRLPE
jgi:hypothetical protein